jgi:hypothetical protein
MKSVIQVWLITMLSGVCGSMGVGVFLERLTVLVSYYELTAPGEYMRMSLLWGLPMTAILAALSTWRVPSRICRRQSLYPMVVAIIAMITAVLIAGASGLFSKMAWPNHAGDSGLPASRFWFCRGLHYGVLAMSLIGWFWLLGREWAVIRGSRSACSVGFSQRSFVDLSTQPTEVASSALND